MAELSARLEAPVLEDATLVADRPRGRVEWRHREAGLVEDRSPSDSGPKISECGVAGCSWRTRTAPTVTTVL